MPALGLGLGISRGDSVRSFSPMNIPGMIAWYRPDTGVLHSVSPDIPAQDTETVRRWVNSANPGVSDMNQTTGIQQPLFADNAILFDGVNDRIEGPLAFTGNDFSVVIIGTLDATITTGARLLTLLSSGATNDYDTNTSAIALMWDSDFEFVSYQNSGYLTQLNNDGISPGDDFYVILNSKADGSFIRANGLEASGPAFSPSLAPVNILIGVGLLSGGAAGHYNGAMRHVLIYNASLSDANLVKMISWAEFQL